MFKDNKINPSEPLRVKDIDLRSNPHMAQLRSLATQGEEVQSISLNSLPRVLSPKAPRLAYRKTSHEERSVIHWGQRKLLLSEIEFLTLYSLGPEIKMNLQKQSTTTSSSKTETKEEKGLEVICVYAGAAPGTHTNFLAGLFPHAKFILVDPAPFKACPTEMIEIKQEFFTDETALKIKERFGDSTKFRILFISDIRTADPQVLKPNEIEEAVANDMKMQMDWQISLSPFAAMHKFRLPWAAGKTKYLKGNVYLPVWGRETTTECRLMSTSSDIIEYDNTEYEQQMFYFNRIGRVQYYNHEISNVPGLDHCYDCACEILILKQYLQKIKQSTNQQEVLCDEKTNEEIAEFIDRVNVACSPEGRTLEFHEKFNQRQGWFDTRKYDYEKRKLIVVERTDGFPATNQQKQQHYHHQHQRNHGKKHKHPSGSQRQQEKKRQKMNE